ncbi:MAG: TPM domain-containing protein [Candidatus Limimorpha sp.]|nr:TPM domain-containing protein [Bacteroidales bacterium]MDD5978431.1 TPM domain-containing protein [Bacteroidales bacterium]MDD7276190.1 TPM domain-containing protein [Bacteroidales bacterium]MDY6075280.1 TPM domain-containing protein [Bacteroidales bacterium]
MDARKFFTTEQQHEIVEAIRQAEANTSGEIRVHIENHCRGDIMDRSAMVFNILKMNETAERNGVLIYLAIKDKKFSIIGDEGINKMVEHDFWNDVKDMMAGHFRSGNFTEGIIQGVLRVGEKLKTFFPHKSDDINELSDDISFN